MLVQIVWINIPKVVCELQFAKYKKERSKRQPEKQASNQTSKTKMGDFKH